MSNIPIIGRLFEKAPSIIVEYAGEPGTQPREPKWDYTALFNKAQESWTLQMVYRSIMQEVMRPGVEIKPRFMLRCRKCGAEFQEHVDSCPYCTRRRMDEPHPTQRLRLDRLIKRPNSNRQTFTNILSSIIYDELVVDEWFISVSYARHYTAESEELILIPAEIHVEDPRNIKILSDERGRLGKPEYFCPNCFPDIDDTVLDHPATCRRCGLPMIQTYYIQKIGSKITNRFGRNQMVHGSTYRILPYLYGEPRLASVWEIVWTLGLMDEWFFDTWSEGQIGKLINLPGYTPEQVKDLTVSLAEAKARLDQLDATTGRARTKKNIRNVFITSREKMESIDIMPDPQKMQAMEYYMSCIQAVMGVYGVQAIFVSMIEKGRAGTTPAMQIEVMNRTIEEIQKNKEHIINDYLLPIFGITDWVIKFGLIEKKDELKDAKVIQIKAATIATLRNAMINAKFDENWEIKIDGELDMPPSAHKIIGQTAATPKESDASRRLIEGTTTEREPHGPREPEKNKAPEE